MEKEETVLRTNYKPGRTVKELEHERLVERLNHTPEQSFKIMMDLIRISEKMKKAKIIHSQKQFPASHGHL